MPYYLAVYDINVNRVGKMLKIFRRYMTWVQNSVFEGDLTEAQLRKLQAEATRLMKADEDSIIFYQFGAERYIERTVLGHERGEPGRIL
ncbi:MAG: CRISPR-associated endonuclease Cas2 [Longimicrobiales bacterium]